MRNRRWELVHRFEDAIKRQELQNLTDAESIDIMENLYQFAHAINKDIFKKTNKEKIDVLVKTHLHFNRIHL